MDRNYYLEETKQLINNIYSKKITGILAAHTITNLWYILRKQYSSQQRREIISALLIFFELESIDKPKLLSAISREDFSDFEDCVQDECAVASGADFIITRNKSDFAGSKVKALTPKEAIELFSA